MSNKSFSIFTTLDSSTTLWEKTKSLTVSTSDQVIYCSNLENFKKKKNKQKTRTIVLTPEYLFHVKSSHDLKIKSRMKTEGVTVEYNSVDQNGVLSFRIRFIRNGKYCEFFLTDPACFNQWKIHLNTVFIQTDFHDTYEPIKMLGRGSFACVYLVRNKETGKKFAVKSFTKQSIKEQSRGIESLKNEISILKSLNHNNTVKLKEIYETSNSVYFVMELMAGGELAKRLKKKKQISLEGIQNVMRGILKGLEYCAKNNIVHRDLKPENIMLKQKSSLEECTVKILDFGLATRADYEKHVYTKCGTPGFMAPEIFTASKREHISFTPKSDVYSAGLILYYLLTGSPPFKAKSYKTIIRLNKQADVFLGHPKLDTNPYVFDLLKRMLEKDPVKRISAMEALQHTFFFFKRSSEVVSKDSIKTNQQSSEISSNINLGSSTTHLIAKEPMISGVIQQNVRDSKDSDTGSFYQLLKKKKSFACERDSIYKKVLSRNIRKNIDDDSPKESIEVY